MLMEMKRILMLIFVACFFTGKMYAQDESDNDIYNQIGSMEYKHWKFSPRAYYYSWDYKRVLGIKIPIPGLGIHDNGPAGIGIGGDGYVDEKWRQMYPLRMTASTEALLQAGQTEDEKKFWKEINIKDLLVYADRSTDLPLVGAKTVTSDDRNEFSQRILDDIHEIRELGGSENERIADDLRMEYDIIREEINIVVSAHEANANRLRTLQACNNRLRKLSKKSATIYSAQRLKHEPWMRTLSNYTRQRYALQLGIE